MENNSIDRIFHGLFNDVFRTNVKIQKEDDAAAVLLPLPGFTKEAVKIETENGVITVSCEKPDEKNPFQFAFTKQFRVTDDYDMDSVKAEFLNGVLKVSVQLRKESKQKRKTVDIK